MGTFAALGQRINPSVAIAAPLRIDIVALALLGVLTLLPSLPSTERGRGNAIGVRALGPPLVAGSLLGAAFVAPWAAFPWLVFPALAIAWSGKGLSRKPGCRRLGLTVALLAAVINSAVVAGASSRGLRISPEDFATRDFRIHGLLADVPLHDVWAIELKGPPSPTLEELGNAFRRGSPFQATPALMGLGMLRGVIGFALAWDDPRWSDVNTSYVNRLTEADRQCSTTEPGTTLGIWRVLYACPQEGVVETINGTVHVAVAATIGEGPVGPRLFLSFWVGEVNWTTQWYMRLIDPSRRFFVYPSLLRQFAHTWARGGWKPAEEALTGEEK
jgi:hypothetical protein